MPTVIDPDLLPEDVENGDQGHAALHNGVNKAVNKLTPAAIATTTARVVQRIAPIGNVRPDAARAFPVLGEERPTIAPNASESGVSNRKYHVVTPGNSGPILWHGPLSLGANGDVTTTESGTLTAYTSSELGVAFPDALAAGPLTYEWCTDAPTLQIAGNHSGSTPYALYVDGRFVAVITPGGKRQTISWGGVVRPRRYRAVLNLGGAIAAICTDKAYSVWAPTRATPLIGMLGDSYFGTGPVRAGVEPTTIPHIVSRVLGARLATSGFGGSGYLTRSSSGQNNALDRIGRFDALPVSAMVYMLGINDPAAGLQAQAQAVYTRFAQAHPGIPQYVIGPWHPSTVHETTYAAQHAAIIAACQAVPGVTYIENRGWITGSGRAGDPTANPVVAADLKGDGNADRYIGDGTHPTAGVGTVYLGLRVAEALSDAIGVAA